MHNYITYREIIKYEALNSNEQLLQEWTTFVVPVGTVSFTMNLLKVICN